MKIILITLILISSISFAQQWQEIPLEEFRNEISKIEKGLTNNQLISYQADMVVFSSHSGNDTLSSSTTSYLLNAKMKLINLTHLGNLVVQDENHHIICDTINKLIMILDYKKEYFQQKQYVDFEDLLKSKCKAQKITSPTGSKKFQLIFPDGGAFKNVEVHLDDKGNLIKYILYSNAEIVDNRNWRAIERVKPRLEISIRDYKFGKSSEKVKIRKINEFIKDFEKMELTDQFKGFELVDMRTIRATE